MIEIGNNANMWDGFYPRPAFKGTPLPKILNIENSVDLLIESEKSLCRLGDGEFYFISGGGKPVFQCQSDSLMMAMRRILLEKNDDCLIGLPLPHLYIGDNIIEPVLKFATWWEKKAIDLGYLDWINRSWTYLDTSLTIPYHHYHMNSTFWSLYFSRISELFAHQKVLLVSGDQSVVDGNKTFYHEVAAEVKVLTVPTKNCWRSSDEVLKEIRSINRNHEYVVILSCGPAATVWAWELSHEMRALDLGHLDREYQFWKQGKDPVIQDGFFAS